MIKKSNKKYKYKKEDIQRNAKNALNQDDKKEFKKSMIDLGKM